MSDLGLRPAGAHGAITQPIVTTDALVCGDPFEAPTPSYDRAWHVGLDGAVA